MHTNLPSIRDLKLAELNLPSADCKTTAHTLFEDLDDYADLSEPSTSSNSRDNVVEPPSSPSQETAAHKFYYEQVTPDEALIDRVNAELEESLRELEEADAELAEARDEAERLKRRGAEKRQEMWDARRLAIEEAKQRRLFSCYVCGRVFCSESLVQRHVVSAHVRDHKKFPHKCSKCDQRFQLPHHKRRHEETVHGSKLECKLCPSSYKTADSLEMHMARTHGIDSDGNKLDPKAHKCQQCGQFFSLEKEMTRHAQYCQRRKQENRLKSPKSTPLQMSKNAPPSPALSSTGSLGSSNASSLTRRSVLDKSCPICALPCASIQSRNRHMQRKHPNEATPQLLATKTFYVPLQVSSPALSSTGSNQDGVPSPESEGQQQQQGGELFICNECGKALASSSWVLYHKREQHGAPGGEKCEQCGKVFGAMSLLRKHKCAKKRLTAVENGALEEAKRAKTEDEENPAVAAAAATVDDDWNGEFF